MDPALQPSDLHRSTTSYLRRSISVIMASIRSNLNSVCNVSGGLLALKKRFATCFKAWRRKASLTTKQHHDHHQQQQQQQHQLIFNEITLHEKTAKNLKDFNTRLKSLFVQKKTENLKSARKKREVEKCEDQKVEIVAKLLSSTLLATATTVTTTSAYAEFVQEEQRGKDFGSSSCSIDRSESNMTIISSNSFREICDEYPDLEVEVRSILLARAQDGATISEIRDDYKKNTGLHFPVYNNITDFLLSIPSVTAYCDEQGTRIFNILPTEKTKHLYDMVTTQKPQVLRPNYIRYGHNAIQRNHYSNRLSSDNNNNNEVGSYYNNNNIKRPYYANEDERAINTLAKFHAIEKDTDSAVSAGGERLSCYEDNFHHLKSRLCCKPHIVSNILVAHKNDVDNNNNMNNNNNNNNDNKNMDCIVPENNTKNNNFNNKLGSVQQKQQQRLKKQSEPTQNDVALKQYKTYRLSPFRIRHMRPIPSWTSPTATRSSEYNESVFTTDSDYGAHLLDFPLLGDDFFLYLARMELRCKFKKYEKVLQSGLCVSGQTISSAIKRIQQMAHRDSPPCRIIVNIGSVDIMQGKPLVQIEHHFRALINLMHRNSFTPILTTLAPLANYSHDQQMKEKLERFNEFIKREGAFLTVVDIWSCLVNEKRQILFDCYQNEPRRVTGTPEPHVFWNKIGRQRVLQMITTNIEY